MNIFKDKTPSRDKKWACYNKSLNINIKESTYMAYRYKFMKSRNIIKNEPYEVRLLNFYANAASKKRRGTKSVSLHSPYKCKIPITRVMIIKDTGSSPKRARGDFMKGGRRFRNKKIEFLDFEFDSKVVGNKWSCIQDFFAIVGNIYGKDFKDEIYKDYQPRTYNDTGLFSVLQGKAVKKTFSLS